MYVSLFSNSASSASGPHSRTIAISRHEKESERDTEKDEEGKIEFLCVCGVHADADGFSKCEMP
jgi:hypothetical protein